MRKKALLACVLSASVVLGVTACGSDGGEPKDLDFTVNYDGITTAKIDAGVSVHDPSIINADGKYYIFGSHMSTAVSDALRTWTSLGDGYKVKDQIYYELMANEDAFDYAGSKKSVIPNN